MPVLNDLKEEKVTSGDAEITFDDNITNINNNKVTLKKEATFVVDEEGKINDSFDINDERTKLKSHTSSTSPAGNGLVKIRKSKSEHQLADSNSDEIKKGGGQLTYGKFHMFLQIIFESFPKLSNPKCV